MHLVGLFIWILKKESALESLCLIDSFFIGVFVRASFPA
jgi:hypothetical protein